MATAPVDLVPVDFDPFRSGEVAAVVQLTPAQREIWLACAMDPTASIAYNLSLTLRIVGPLALSAMSAAIAELVRRHDALRMTFSADGRSATVSTEARAAVRHADLSCEESPETSLQNLLAHEAATPYDLENGPLFRATIVRMRADTTCIVLGAHHLVCDGWSLAVLLRELVPLYANQSGSRSVELPPAPSFAAHSARCSVASMQTDIEYFVEQLKDVLPPLELPTDRPRRPGRSLASSTATWKLDALRFSALKTRAAGQGLTPFVALFTAWSVLLGRLSGQEDIVIGLPVGLQSRIGEPGLVGHCTHLLPVRVRLDPGASLGAAMAALRQVILDVTEHPLATLAELLPRLAARRDPSGRPLLSVLFNLDSQFSNARPSLDGCTVTFKPNPRAAETFEIFLNAYEDETAALVIDCQYATELWDRATIDSWLGGLGRLLEAFIGEPELTYAAAPIISTEDLADLTEHWNRTKATLERATVLDLIARSAAAYPAAVALRDGHESMTYEELLRHIKKAAQGLRSCGIGPGHIVGLCVERSVWMVVFAAAIWGTGAAYLPVDPEHPADRIAQLLAGARLVLVDESTEDAVHRLGKDQMLVKHLAHYETEGLLEASPDGLAYVLHTSGSTGRPKGVEVTHQNLLNFVASMLREPGIRRDDVVAAVVTLSFDIAGFELFVPLAAGATVVVADEETARDGRLLAELMTTHGVTMLQATPSTYRLLRAAGYRPQGLRALVGGEAFPPDLGRWLLENGATVTNCYGPTETTIWSTLHRVTDVEGPIPIGRPIANTSVYVLDARSQPVPKGCFGEIAIAGLGVARGYRDAPELTKDRFIVLSLPNGQEERVYRTGDIGRWRHDGVLEVTGRRDDQVKIRGHRIELGDIEAALATLEGVREVGVAVVRPAEGEPRLAAFLVVEKGKMVTPTEMRSHLRRRLPEAMIPALLSEVAALPKTQNGKIDRRELARLGAVERATASVVIHPTTPTERLLVELYQHLLRLTRISCSDNFFDLGGDSIASVEAAVAIEKATHVRISPRELLLNTIADLGMTIDARRSAVTS